MALQIVLYHRVLRRLRFLAHWRCMEPVVVFESDDWGLERRACSTFIRAFGEPGEWADEQMETVDDLSRLYEVLQHYRDPEGRPACFTANFVVANPDFEAIARYQFTRLFEIPIGQNNDEIKKKWLEGIEKRVFLPQYHGRSHFSPRSWLRDLQTNVPGARELFAFRCHGGLSLLKGEGYRYHSEYLDWHSGIQPAFNELVNWLKGGINFFKQVFGFLPRSTIAPHYIFTPLTCRAWCEVGIEFVQGAGYRLLRSPNGRPYILSHVLGERSSEGLLFMVRNVKFDPRPQRPKHGVDAALKQAKALFKSHLPVIIDTHRINYTGPWREEALKALHALLTELVSSYKPYFLTSVELGEAIVNGGKFRDVWTGKIRHLTPIDPLWRQFLRMWFHRYNAYLAYLLTKEVVINESQSLGYFGLPL